MKKILLISYYFEPCQVIGAKRWSDFFYLFDKDSDFDITVLTRNWKGEKGVNNNVIYIGEEIEFKPFKSINKKFTTLDYLLHPSVYFRSLERGMFNDNWFKEAKEWVSDNREKDYDVVIATYTPLNAIRLGSFAKDIFKARLVVDMRDMMSIQGQKLKVPFLNYIDNTLDKFLLRKANEILSVGPTVCQKASKFYNKKTHLIYNSFLEKDFIHNSSESPNDNKLVFSYMGTMGIKRNPRGLIEIIEEFCSLHKNFLIEINFASQDDPQDFLEGVVLDNVKINWLGYLDKINIKKLKERTNYFILLEDLEVNGKENVTGKVFELMVEKKPILAYCHVDSDIKYILDESGIGKIINSKTDFENFLFEFNNDNFKISKEKILIFSKENQYNIIKSLM